MKKRAATDMEFPIRGCDVKLVEADFDAYFRLERALNLIVRQAAEERERQEKAGNTKGQNTFRKKSDLTVILDSKRELNPAVMEWETFDDLIKALES
jgi:hypothetical protein